MDLEELFAKKGIGIMGTSSKDGKPNLAIYSPPILKENMAIFGATRRVTYRNLTENPLAMFMYIVPGEKLDGVRMELVLKKVEDSGETLERIKKNFIKIGYERLAEEIKYALYFEIKNIFPLKGR